MSGKKSAINTRFRELLAKIQREFHFPKVFAIRCPIHTGTHPFREDVSVIIQALPFPEADCHNFQTSLKTPVLSGSLDEPSCLTVEPLEELASETRAIPCYQMDNLPTRNPQTDIPVPEARILPEMIVSTEARQIQTALPLPRIMGNVGSFQTHIRTNTRRIHEEGIRFPLTLMKDLPMRQIIRYRAATLRKVGKKSNEIDFVGVCPIIPPAPLRLKGLHSDRGRAFAVGVLKGIPDRYLGQQSWVIYRLRKSRDIRAVIVRGEG
jgi:hypothetical protein